jgi:hypothetical protein
VNRFWFLNTAAASPWGGMPQCLAVLALCLASRLFTTIRHIEDADSLRFALAMIDFDVTRLQPQFPGYPVFCFFAKLFQLMTGSYALAFSILGGLGLFVLIHYALCLLEWKAREPRGLALIALFVFNPMLWLLGNRYMSDLSGVACMFAAFFHLSRQNAAVGFFLAGLSAGWRLSFLPFLFLPMVLNLARNASLPALGVRVAMGVSGILVWLIPFIGVTGWHELLAAAQHQTNAHFYATGGTYHTEPDWLLRFLHPFIHLWTDGLGAWWPGRHAATLGVSALVVVLLIRAGFKLRSEGFALPWKLLAGSCGFYAVWILVFQNVVHQTRHVLPWVPPTLMLLAMGWSVRWSVHPRFTMRSILRRPNLDSVLLLAVFTFLGAYAFVGTSLAKQHMRPAGIAQAKDYLTPIAKPDMLVICAPWVQKCLSAQGLHFNYLAVEKPEELQALSQLDPSRTFITVGDYSDHIRRKANHKQTFYHNPYVNRIGSQVDVIHYAAEAETETKAKTKSKMPASPSSTLP